MKDGIINNTGRILIQEQGYDGPDIWHPMETIPMHVDERQELTPDDLRQVSQVINEMSKYTEHELRTMIDQGRRAAIMLRYRTGKNITGHDVDALS